MRIVRVCVTIPVFVWLLTTLLALLGSGCGRAENHGGRPMSYWIANLTSPDSALRHSAAEAFAHDVPSSPEAVAALLQALGTEQEADVHATLADALSAIGPNAVAAVPTLTRLLRDEHVAVRQRAAVALGTVGAGSTVTVPALVRALGDPDHDVRAAAAGALEHIGPAASTAVGPLVSLMNNDRIGWVRLRAAAALGAIHAEPDIVVPALARNLGDDWGEMRRQALVSLAAFGPAANDARSAIEARTRDSVTDVREAALRTARAIQGGHPAAGQ